MSSVHFSDMITKNTETPFFDILVLSEFRKYKFHAFAEYFGVGKVHYGAIAYGSNQKLNRKFGRHAVN